MKLFIIFAISLSNSAFSGTTTCSSHNGKVTYEYFQNDGGANMGTRVTWDFEGDRYSDILELPVVPSIQTGQDDQTIIEISEEVQGHYKVNLFVQQFTAVRTLDEQEMFSGHMFCLSSRWIGPPRP